MIWNAKGEQKDSLADLNMIRTDHGMVNREDKRRVDEQLIDWVYSFLYLLLRQALLPQSAAFSAARRIPHPDVNAIIHVLR
jgi:hypothetical protein